MPECKSVLEQLDTQACMNHAVPTQDRLQALIQALAQERQSRYGPEFGNPMGHVQTAFEEVVWGVDMVARRLEFMRQTQSPAIVRRLLRELEDQQQWLQDRLEVLHGLLGTLSGHGFPDSTVSPSWWSFCLIGFDL